MGLPERSGTPVQPSSQVDDADLEEPEIPEYLLAERRQGSGGRGGGGRGGRPARGGHSAYQAALERERYGRGGSGGLNRVPEPPRMPRQRDAGRGGGGGGGGGGRPTGRMRPPAAWSGWATWVWLPSDQEGISCALVTLAAEASGDLPEPELGGRRSGRGGDAPSLEPAGGRLASTYRVTLEGRLWFSLEKARPVALEVEGKLHTERSIERDSERGSFVVEIVQDGAYERAVTVEEPTSDDEPKDE
jgi:hypothetical protein